MSQLKVNSIVPVAGVASGQGGGIVQVVTGSTSTQVETTGTTFVDTNLTANITPLSTNNKILVIVHQHIQISMGTANGGGVQLLRGSTVIEEARPANATGPFQYYFGNFSSNMNFYFFHNSTILDSPSTTSATTYKTQMRIYSNNGSNTIRSQSQSATGVSPTSVIHLLEVSA